MYIERLTLKNFKSFGGEQQLPFAPGFTAIVGPNGSGKSNILDGLRWVLGESGAARLRITRQSDLIFQGSAGLSEATEADVTLDLADASAHSQLRRHLDPNGGTLYVNGARTRVQDLANFKAEWRLEGDRSAFIGQGEVGAAVLQKPFQRRINIEELFGIDVYRKKRDSALEELKETTGEMTRLETLMGDLRARREEIAPDLANAKKAGEYQARLENVRAALYHTRRHDGEKNLAEQTSRHDALSSRLKGVGIWAKLWKTSLERLREQGSEYARERSALNDQLLELTPRLDDTLRREAELNTEKSENDFAARRAEEERSRLQSQLKEEEKRRNDLAAETGKLNQAANTLNLQIADLEDRLAGRAEELAAARAKRQQLIEREASLQEEAQAADARAATLELQGKERLTALETLRAKKDALVTQLTRADGALEALEDEAERLSAERASLATKSQEMAIRAQSLRREISRAEAELESLLQRTEAGLYPRPVQMILSAVKLGRLKIDAVPAVESFSCDAALAPALEAYLGGRLFWLLVDTMAQARIGIDMLKERQGGRATFLPLERCRPSRAAKTPRGDGVLGWAIDLVTPNPRWGAAVEHLLGDLLVVNDFATGQRLSAGARFPIMSLDGEVFSPGGTVSGGKNAGKGGALTTKNQIAELEKNIAADKEAQTIAAKNLQEAEATEAAAAQALEKKRAEASEAKISIEALRRSVREQNDELNALILEDNNAGAKIASYHDAAKAAREGAQKAHSQIEELQISGDDDGESEKLSELRTQSLLANERLSAKKSELERSVRAMSDLRRASSENDATARKIVADLAALSERAQALRAEKDERLAEKKSIEQKIDDLDSRNSQAARRMERHLLRSQRSQNEFERLSNDELILKNSIEAQSEQLNSLIANNEEKYPYPADFQPSESADKLEGSARYLERQIRELGEVNMGALSEDKSLAGRLEFLGTQLGDVQKGMSGLQDIIAATDKQAGQIFADALVKIDRRFNELFQQLFGGGEAHLKVQEGMELWETGVEIIARPPGKKTLYLAQLSGGEQSLTALSLLFASMEVARCPLAVLDEVDAALDEANLTRFANMVADYSKNIQVIAMTHRRQTMERAEVMYGVTMSEPGLSQIVSVKVDQWD